MTDQGQIPPPEDLWAAFLDPDEADPALSIDERELLERTEGALARQEMWDGPSSDARSRLLAQAAAEPAGSAASVPTARSRAPWLVAIGTGTAAAVLAVALILSSRTPDPSGTSYEIAGGPYSPDVTAQVLVDPRANGVALTLSLGEVPPAVEGTYYSGWVMNADGPVPIGSFHNRSGEGKVVLWSGVDTDDYPMIMITLQDEGAPLVPSNRVVLQGQISN